MYDGSCVSSSFVARPLISLFVPALTLALGAGPFLFSSSSPALVVVICDLHICSILHEA